MQINIKSIHRGTINFARLYQSPGCAWNELYDTKYIYFITGEGLPFLTTLLN